jgi:hypothetical protein
MLEWTYGRIDGCPCGEFDTSSIREFVNREAPYSPNVIRARASPSTISSPDSSRMPREPAGTVSVLPLRTMLVP